MTSNDKPPQNSKSSFSFKRISALIGLIGAVIGVIIGGSQIFKQVQQSKKIKREVKIFLEVGDLFAEKFKLNKAIEEYNKALDLDKENIAAQRKIITSLRQKLYLEFEPLPVVNDVLSRIYKLYALDSHLKKDINLLLEEARILIYDNSLHDALKVLETAKKEAPDEPEVLALFGFVRALTSPEDRAEGLALLEKAIESQPNNGLYHYYRAQAFEDAQNYSESIREYYQAAKLLSVEDIWSKKLHNNSIKKLDEIFMRFFRDDGPLTLSLNIPLEERALIYEYVIGNYEKLPTQWKSLKNSRHGYLATLFHELGKYEKADEEIRKTLNTNYKDTIDSGRSIHQDEIPWVELHIRILEEGALDQNTLISARNYLSVYYKEKEKNEEEYKYREILELTEFGRIYKVGLKVPRMESDEGISVLKVFEGYPFHKAGLRKGDIILEIAHRKVRQPYDIERILTKFNLGNNIPVKVKRGNDILFLTLIIE